MKLIKYHDANVVRWGVLSADGVRPLRNDPMTAVPEIDDSAAPLAVERLSVACPVSPGKIVCVGRNYASHAAELGNDVPTSPLLFLKAPSSLLSDGDEILVPTASQQVEHEGELGVVIGTECRELTDEDDALARVLGYICLNDVTARDIQRHEIQFTRAKSFDTFCPVSAVIETDLDPRDVRVTTRVNGVVKQDGRTSQMVFPVDFLIRYISNQMTLYPGDVIATGTPAGVSRLDVGDVCEVEIEGVGLLRNPVATRTNQRKL